MFLQVMLMENYHRPNILSMGVINLTPNSFSESKPKNLLKYFSDLLLDCSIIDIGAESTAPMNASIDAVTEFKRFEASFFPLLQLRPDPVCTLSIDTYRPEVFYEVYHVIKHYWPKTQLIFNDVSGKIDDDLLSLLKEDKLDFDYVYCHNLCPLRDLAGDHMQFISDQTDYRFFQDVLDYFKQGLGIVQSFSHKVWIDPCFGFSKTREQNQYLLKHFATFMRHFSSEIGFLYGISRKSFLRFPKTLDAKDELVQSELDHIQTAIMVDLLKARPHHSIIFRSHSQLSVKSALKTCLILE
jgi:dihydropteroate synthase